MSFVGQKLLIANRGEIAVRIIRTAKRLGLPTVAIYTLVDATSPHVQLADESFLLHLEDTDLASNSKAYLDAEEIVNVCAKCKATLVHPGYGFLSENAEFARILENRGIRLLGPTAEVIEDMGLKHRARAIAIDAKVPVVPGSGLLSDVKEAEAFASEVGFPIMIKATAGGGGMNLIVCKELGELLTKFGVTQDRARSLFGNDGLFIERFYPSARHIEVQIFGNGTGNVIHMGERECSVQRRHQKLIEEAPSPFLIQRPELREQICAAAVRLGSLIKYKSAGTVEFLVDDLTGQFFFLEMNTRLQVEHGVTEMVHPGLDIVELMIRQGIIESKKDTVTSTPGVSDTELDQDRFAKSSNALHAIEARIYSENPARNFEPSPGLLQYVKFPEPESDGTVRIDSWVSTGTAVSPYYDPLLAKVIVSATTRREAISKLSSLLTDEESSEGPSPRQGLAIHGPPNNIDFLRRALAEEIFQSGSATTEWVDGSGVAYTANAMSVISPGLNATVQDLPIRSLGLGIPPSGPMDELAFQAANIIIGNQSTCEGLEIVVPSGKSTLAFSVVFQVESIIAVTGARAIVQVNDRRMEMWSRIRIPASARVSVYGAGHPTMNASDGEGKDLSAGLRVYMSVWGGFPRIPRYLGSKSTSMGNGGYQGRALQSGDMLYICHASSSEAEDISVFLPRPFIPTYPTEWTIFALPGPHDDTEFLTQKGIDAFYSRQWKVSSASNRMGIRLESTTHAAPDNSQASGPVLDWARENGGEGGSHPSNILDNGYAIGCVNLNGETPVILTCEGPSMGGYACISTIASADRWKLGQLRPGDLIRFKRISFTEAMRLRDFYDKWLESVFAISNGFSVAGTNLLDFKPEDNNYLHDPKLYVSKASSDRIKVVFRQAGDSAILIEFGDMKLDFFVRARVHAFETQIKAAGIQGITELCACIRSTMIHYDPLVITQSAILSLLVEIENRLPASVTDMVFDARKLTFPIVLDDKWNREALDRYMRSSRDKAVYLPSNIDYLARNNGLKDAAEALTMLVSSPWLVFGVGFYLACPFLVPVDPRCRLIGQKMNPSRTFTPRGAVGIAGPVAAIYPVESPGGYQLYGRTLPAWQPWGKGVDFEPSRPWLLEPFDQVAFEVVSEAEYIEIEKLFDSGRYKFKIESSAFVMKDYVHFVSTIDDELVRFKHGQAEGMSKEEAREHELWKEWQDSQAATNASNELNNNSDPTASGSRSVTASVSGTVWKIKAKPGDVIRTSDDVLLILEAMKTEVSVRAGEENIGGRIVGFGRGIKEGAVVQAGDLLVMVE